MIVTFNKDRQRFEAQTGYDERATANPLLKKSGFSFDFQDAKVWHSQVYASHPQRDMAAQVRITAILWDYCDSAAREQMGGYLETVKEVRESELLRTELLTLSRATETEIDIPVPGGLAYLPYQKAGIIFALKMSKDRRTHLVGGVLIADEMGL